MSARATSRRISLAKEVSTHEKLHRSRRLVAPFEVASGAGALVGSLFGVAVADAPMRVADACITASFGKLVRVSPRVTLPKREPAADPDRMPITVTGVFTLTSDEAPIEGSRRGSELSGFSSVAVAQGKLWLSAESIVALGFMPRKDDAVSLSSRVPVRTFVAVRVDPSDVGDVTLPINPEQGD